MFTTKTLFRSATLATALGIALGAAQPPTAPPAPAQPPEPAGRPGAEAGGTYTRVVEQEDGRMTLEIAARTFIPAADKTGPTVHLVGAVHVGDKPFYAALQEMLDRCDLVLFEGVKPPGAGAFDAELDDAGKVKATKARVDFLLLVAEQERSRTGRLPESLAQAVEDAGKRWKTMIASSLTDAWGRPVQYALVPADAPAAEQHAVVTSVGPDGVSQEGRGDDIRAEGKGAPKRAAAKDPGLQSKLADALGLTFQLDAMDSSKPNWRSSDMSIDQLQARFRAAGIEGDRLFSMLDGSSFVGQIASLALGIVKASPQLSGMVKVMMVDMLGSEDALAAGPADLKKMMAVILVDRNDVVLNDLRGVIEREQRKDVAVFYGAGHLPDMEMKLRRDFGYTPAQERWTPAITVDPKAAGMSAKQVQAMRQSMKRQMTAAAQAEQKRAERAKAREKAKEEGEGQGAADPQK